MSTLTVKRAKRKKKPCRQRLRLKLARNPEEAAANAALRYVHDDQPGIRRKRRGKNFAYYGPDGKLIRDAETRARIRSLAIPPAWTEVWICPTPHGHLQATGRDAKGRKQYRYHPRWREARDETKYARMILFGAALPKIRKRIEEDMRLPGLSRAKVLATVVRLLEATLIRIGNEEYARKNRSVGLTTMRDQHVEVEGGELHFEFRGKSGKHHTVDIRDRRLARIVKRCQDLPGQELFQYLDENGERHDVTSCDVNDYLKEITGEDFTAKDFRTWAGTVLAALALQEFERFDSQTQAKKNIVQAIETVSEKLGNTPAICRKCYVHPAVFEAYLDGTMLETLRKRTEETIRESLHDLEPEEAAVVALLQERLTQETAKSRRHAG